MSQRQLSSQTTRLLLHAAGASDTGQVRVRNEDAFAICEPPDRATEEQLGTLALLADGVGGQAAGAIASQLAVATITSRYYDLAAPAPDEADVLSEEIDVQHLDGRLPDDHVPLQQIRLAFAAAHVRLQHNMASYREYAGMATTCVAAIVKGTQLVIAHVGDSRAYLVRTMPTSSSPLLIQLTADHSMAAELLRLKAISVEQAQHSFARHILTRALGGDGQTRPVPDLTTVRLQAGDRVVLCCDGLWNMVSDEQLTLVVRNTSPDLACHELIHLANKAGGNDNISVVVFSFGPDDPEIR